MATSQPTRTTRPPQPIEAASHPSALLRIETVQVLTGLSRSGIYAKVRGGAFPQPIKQGTRNTRWRAGSVTAWLESLGKEAA